MLKMLLPIMFPMAIPLRFFTAATALADNSGKEVPSAIKIIEIINSDMPNATEISSTDDMISMEPMTSITPPIRAKTRLERASLLTIFPNMTRAFSMDFRDSLLPSSKPK